jgi:hypothetical protein
MASIPRTLALVIASVFALTLHTACSSDDGDDGDDKGSGGSSNGGGSNGGSSNGGGSNGGSGGGMGDCTDTGCPDGETCSQCMGANGETVNACIPDGVACN